MRKDIPPHIILHKSQEVIFYIPNYKSNLEINSLIKKLELDNYRGMQIKSKCIFNRLQKDNEIKNM